MSSRQTTRAVLAALAAGTSLHDALELGAGFERNKRGAEALRAAAARVRAGEASGGDITRLDLDPPVIGEILAGVVGANANPGAVREAADLAIEALQSPRSGHPLTMISILIGGALTALGVSAILARFVAPVFGKMDPALLAPANFRAAAASVFALCAFIAALAALIGRMGDSSFKLNLLAQVAPWWVFPAPSTFIRLATERRMDRASAFFFAAAASATGVELPIPTHEGPPHLDGDSPARALARLGRLARLRVPRIDAGKIFELVSMVFLVLSVFAGCSFYLLVTKIGGMVP